MNRALLLLSLIALHLHAAEPKTLRLLTVGNSFSHNATHYLGDIAKAAGDTLILREDNIGGSSFDIHLKKIAVAEKDPKSKLGTYTESRSLKDDLTQMQWDYITIQQASIKSHDVNTYRPHAQQLADFIRKHAPSATLIMHQTWEYRVDDPRFSVKEPKPGEPKTPGRDVCGIEERVCHHRKGTEGEAHSGGRCVSPGQPRSAVGLPRRRRSSMQRTRSPASSRLDALTACGLEVEEGHRWQAEARHGRASCQHGRRVSRCLRVV